ncbi:MAG: hypothetical protein AB8B55_11300 [Mariniblastus sp.]
MNARRIDQRLSLRLEVLSENAVYSKARKQQGDGKQRAAHMAPIKFVYRWIEMFHCSLRLTQETGLVGI